MAMEEDLVARLKAVPAIYAITGDAVQFHQFGRGDSGGQVKLSIVTPGSEWTHDGPDNLDLPRVRFDMRSDDPDEAFALHRLIRAEMETEDTTGGTLFHPAHLEAGPREIEIGEQEGGDSLFQLQSEFMFYHEETA